MKKELIDFGSWLNENVIDDSIFELDDILYDISINLFDYRINNGLKQKDLAEKLGVTQTMISKLESGMYNPTVEQLFKIAKKLDFDFSIVFKEKDCIDSVVKKWDKARQKSKLDFSSKEYGMVVA